MGEISQVSRHLGNSYSNLSGKFFKYPHIWEISLITGIWEISELFQIHHHQFPRGISISGQFVTYNIETEP